jgi:hypothetical protein
MAGIFRRAPTAIVGQISKQFVHGFKLRCIDHRAARALNRHQAGAAQPVEMKCQLVGRKPESSRDFPGRHADGSCCDQEPEYLEPVVLGECGERHNSV